MDNKDNIRAIAFYLPQYHPIPENNEWWGDGFTEWTNVKKAKQLFPGHYQPRVPTNELGYYDLRDFKVREKQAKLAKEHGIYGFCYYHYWFGGKKLLETPLQEVLKSGEPYFPFCICWANENWTRRWDGRNDEILIGQSHSDKDDLAFINDLIPAFSDNRYIRIYGKPLLIIYHTELFPNIMRSVEIWRKSMLEAGVGEIYLAKVERMGPEGDPKSIGFDAAIEFALDWVICVNRINFNSNSRHYKDYDKGLIERIRPHMFDYDVAIQNILLKEDPDYKLFRGVFPSWDNSPRRGLDGTIIINSSPEIFEYFLRRQVQNTFDKFMGDEKLLFINAWNEWGEGCYLEPDEKYGKEYLAVCKKLLSMPRESIVKKDILQKEIESLELTIQDIQEEYTKLKAALQSVRYLLIALAQRVYYATALHKSTKTLITNLLFTYFGKFFKGTDRYVLWLKSKNNDEV
jgi:hypothetical protein